MPDSSLTKRALAQSLKELMQQHPLSKINVGDICARCSMNRKSFYYHFKDKYDLVNWIYYTEFLDNLLGQEGDEWDVLTRLCVYFYENQDFYKNALEIRGQNSFYEYFSEVLQKFIAAYSDDSFGGAEYHDFYVTLFADAFRSSILRWLLEGCQIPPEKFVSLIKDVMYGIANRINEKRQA